MSKKDKRENCMASTKVDDTWKPNCYLEKHHAGKIHVSPGMHAITIWNEDGVVVEGIDLISAAQAEQPDDETHDRQDEQNRPQHDDSDTPIPAIVSGQTYRIVTPEIQAVLDAARGWAEWHRRAYPGSPVLTAAEDDLFAALALLDPPPRKMTAIEALQAMLDHRRRINLASPNTGDILSAIHDAGFEILPMR